MLNKYAFIVALSFTIALGILSFINLNKVPNTGLSFEDKLFHFIAYALLAYLWFKAFKNSKNRTLKSNAILISLLFAIIYGTIIEVLQGQLTADRVTEIGDSFANAIGALFTAAVLSLKKIRVKKN